MSRLYSLRYWLALVPLAALLAFWDMDPEDLFEVPNSTILLSADGTLLSAGVAADGQWRFPLTAGMPDNYRAAVLTFEDKRFYRHNGIDPAALLRAIYLNWQQRSVVSGGSTITMQVARMALGNLPRTFWNKCREMVWAVRMELSLSKEQILHLYASQAPYGGNVVGLEAAGYRYFARSLQQLSWAEAATLAVLPNSPALIHPGRNREALLQKRNKLLEALTAQGHLNTTDLALACQEPLPENPHPLPQEAYHLWSTLQQRQGGPVYHSTLDAGLQQRVSERVTIHHRHQRLNELHNAAALVVEVSTGEVKAYVGNVLEAGEAHGQAVDMIPANRSSGSIIKPFLYAAALADGILLPQQWLHDIPVNFGGYAPVNYDEAYDGMVAADQALARSLNVPAVQLLKTYGVARFRDRLQSYGFTTFRFPAAHYGLTLILGGGEVTLFELAQAYRLLALSIQAAETNGITLLQHDDNRPLLAGLHPGAAFAVAEALTTVKRPEEEAAWESFARQRRIAWKTGTSYGHRDAWAVGFTPQYVVAVWVGNADGEGRPACTGAQAAAPLLFDIFRLLPYHQFFTKPYDFLEQQSVCKVTGYPAGIHCTDIMEQDVPQVHRQMEQCPFHKDLLLNSGGTHQVSSACYPLSDMQHRSFLVLPPTVAYYYRQRHADLPVLPVWLPGCNPDQNRMTMLYPLPGARIFLPVAADGRQQSVLLEAGHQYPDQQIYWFLNSTYMGSTRGRHQLEVTLPPGDYLWVLTDEDGEMRQQPFTIIGQ